MARLVNISDVCNEIFAGGDAPKDNMSIEKTDEFYVPIYSNGEAKNGLYGYTNFARVTKPSITISARGTIGFAAIRNDPFVPIVRLITLTPNPTLIDIRYLYYAVQNYHFDGSGTSIPQLTVPMLKKYSFPLPDMGNQLYIVRILDKLADLISLRKQQLAKLDELVKARFVEMFGDPGINPYGWKITDMAHITRSNASNGFFAKRDEYCDNGNIQVLGVSNIVNRMYSNVHNLPKAMGSEADICKYQVKYGDMLFCRSSLVEEGIGKASIVPQNISDNTLFECHVIRLPLDMTKCIPEFIQVLSTTRFFRAQVISQANTATMTTIGQDGILKTKIVLPPLELQRVFFNFVRKLEESKLTIQQSLDKLKVIKKLLMQEYFG